MSGLGVYVFGNDARQNFHERLSHKCEQKWVAGVGVEPTAKGL